MKKYVVMCGCMLFVVLSFLSSAIAVEITADMITKEGTKTTRGKIYVKGDKCRITRNTSPIYFIVRGDNNLVWQINGFEGTYVEAKLSTGMKPKIEEKMTGEVSRKQVGQETIDSHPVKKYEVVVTQGKQSETYYQWWATDVGFPVRVATANGKWVVDYKNIMKGGVTDTTFDLPGGLQRDMTEVPDVLH
jgi:hypothetical protein